MPDVKKNTADSYRRTMGVRLDIMLSVWCALSFFVIALQVFRQNTFLTEVDLHIVNLIATLRDTGTARVFLFFTYLGNWQIIVSTGVLMLIIFFLLSKRRSALLLFISVASGEAVYSGLKLIFHHSRPDSALALITQGGYSLPSGHALVPVIFYGMLAYFLRQRTSSRLLKLLILAATTLLIFLIGVSRIYLSVHWPSDISAGWFLGSALLFLFLGIAHKYERGGDQPVVSPALFRIISATLLLGEGFFFFVFFISHPLRVPLPTARPGVVLGSHDDLVAAIHAQNFPKFSETISGKHMEPVSFIVAGPKERLISAFEQAGWFVADELDTSTLWHMSSAALENKPYPKAPVTPSFIEARTETIAFQKPTIENSSRRRHHTRFWITNFRYGGAPLWVATASFDKNLRYIVTHSIDPDIDAERALIKGDLEKTGIVSSTETIQLVPPLQGTNQIGDKFFTDGRAHIMMLRQ